MRFLIEEKCPSLYKEFRPVRWLFRYVGKVLCSARLLNSA